MTDQSESVPPADLTPADVMREARHFVQDAFRGRGNTWEAVYACALVDLAEVADERDKWERKHALVHDREQAYRRLYEHASAQRDELADLIRKHVDGPPQSGSTPRERVSDA